MTIFSGGCFSYENNIAFLREKLLIGGKSYSLTVAITISGATEKTKVSRVWFPEPDVCNMGLHRGHACSQKAWTLVSGHICRQAIWEPGWTKLNLNNANKHGRFETC